MLSWGQFIPIISLLIAIMSLLVVIVIAIAKVSHRVGNLERDIGNLRTEFTAHRKENCDDLQSLHNEFRDDFQALRNGLDHLNQNFIDHLASHNKQN